MQWVAPFVSEFPEKVSAFYWARTVHRAPMALMNMVSSNINQWTLLAAMLPIVYSISRGSASSILFDDQQKLELLMTLGQSLVGMLFLVNMRLAWWEAASLFSLWLIQVCVLPRQTRTGVCRLHGDAHTLVRYGRLSGVVHGGGALLSGEAAKMEAFRLFAVMWRQHVWPSSPPAVK